MTLPLHEESLVASEFYAAVSSEAKASVTVRPVMCGKADILPEVVGKLGDDRYYTLSNLNSEQQDSINSAHGTGNNYIPRLFIELGREQANHLLDSESQDIRDQENEIETGFTYNVPGRPDNEVNYVIFRTDISQYARKYSVADGRTPTDECVKFWELATLLHELLHWGPYAGYHEVHDVHKDAETDYTQYNCCVGGVYYYNRGGKSNPGQFDMYKPGTIIDKPDGEAWNGNTNVCTYCSWPDVERWDQLYSIPKRWFCDRHVNFIRYPYPP